MEDGRELGPFDVGLTTLARFCTPGTLGIFGREMEGDMALAILDGRPAATEAAAWNGRNSENSLESKQ